MNRCDSVVGKGRKMGIGRMMEEESGEREWLHCISLSSHDRKESSLNLQVKSILGKERQMELEKIQV